MGASVNTTGEIWPRRDAATTMTRKAECICPIAAQVFRILSQE